MTTLTRLRADLAYLARLEQAAAVREEWRAADRADTRIAARRVGQ